MDTNIKRIEFDISPDVVTATLFVSLTVLILGITAITWHGCNVEYKAAFAAGLHQGTTQGSRVIIWVP
jgi:hypothetical protein